MVIEQVGEAMGIWKIGGNTTRKRDDWRYVEAGNIKSIWGAVSGHEEYAKILGGMNRGPMTKPYTFSVVVCI